MRLLKLVEQHRDTDKVVSEIIGDPRIWMEVLKPQHLQTLNRMVGTLVRDKSHNTRRRLLGKPHPAVTSIEDAKKRKRGRDRAHAGIRESSLDWPIWGGKLIRLCTRDDIQHSIAMRRKLMAEGRDQIKMEQAAIGLMKGCSDTDLFGDVVSERQYNSACRELKQAVAARK